MDALYVIANVLIIIASIILIVAILMQQGNKAGLGAITGGAESFLGKNKAKGYEAKLVLITKITTGVFIALAILMVAISK